MKLQDTLNQALTTFQQRWNAMALREQNLVLIAASVVLLALLWLIALAPALHSLRTAPQRHEAVERELQTMLQMQAQAQQLRQQPQSSQGDAIRQLEQSLKTELANTAQIQWLGNRAQITLLNTPAPALASWLNQVRDNSHAAVAEMKLNRVAGDTSDAAATVRWSGSLLLDMPGNAGMSN